MLGFLLQLITVSVSSVRRNGSEYRTSGVGTIASLPMQYWWQQHLLQCPVRWRLEVLRGLLSDQ